ncbi:RNA-guided endonuclease InsQ/TnpB family protein [Sodalinema gerasimenkoae]|uniref:RNA-guided endonuclease InsQ/TnpB family protein n=1 Tax=Sodalinema gerasimenkoae TaxID=2862348 RepID=UPI001359C28B|nr:RNA-guided endonuclease TnpB family protein [Sodalinema gerasimenkoae]
MLVLEFKIKGKPHQYAAIDEAIRTAQFVRNKALRYWMDTPGVNKYDLNKYCRVLAREYDFARELNSTARQASAERAWSAIARFFENCRRSVPGKKRCDPAPSYGARERAPREGYPRFKKNGRSVEYKTSGWKLLDPKHIVFTDKKNVGRLKLVGTWDLAFYGIEQIKRVRLVRRADGYYAQFCVKVEVREELKPSGNTVGLDVGLKEFYTDSNGECEPNPRFYRNAEKKLKRAHRRVSKKQKGSANRKKAVNRLGRVHLKISRQREEHAKRLARCVIQSNDLVAYENLRIQNLVRNHCLAKSIHDAGWYQFRKWLEHFGVKFGRITVAVNPAYTSQKCSSCGTVVKKSLSTRTHVCQCGCELDRDHNAAVNILNAALSTVGHTGTWVLDPNASGDLTATLAGANLSGQVGSLKEESPRL